MVLGDYVGEEVYLSLEHSPDEGGSTDKSYQQTEKSDDEIHSSPVLGMLAFPFSFGSLEFDHKIIHDLHGSDPAISIEIAVDSTAECF